jgi:monothiol glutaredoxin
MHSRFRHPSRMPADRFKLEFDMSDTPVNERIKAVINQNDVMLFMKGTPVFPQCGFSAAVVQILNHVGVKFGSADVLVDPEIREGIKAYTNWPTVPQLYVKGEFVGGCDIIREMFEAGELEQMFDEKGIAREAA